SRWSICRRRPSCIRQCHTETSRHHLTVLSKKNNERLIPTKECSRIRREISASELGVRASSASTPYKSRYASLVVFDHRCSFLNRHGDCPCVVASCSLF